ncbi:fructose-specific PTS transporter subunit EIIC [Streptomyces sp. SID13726]|uniref:fructose-specific PTS transporter subunit EIIC n=1 Tax=Streptomyces sp. SID13726 TaxID=2706058 RepID=UPI0013BA3FCA|nr:fructose-specific PTS transporter subunit EIIC [Streptomyces sp. SID13726]NEA98942.1 PTS fructose transporter subunit IIBC [Streptomyces sp. SID13726]
MPSPTSTIPTPMDEHAAPGDHAATRLGRWLTAGTGHLAILTTLGGLLVALAYAIGGWKITASSVSVTGQDFSWLRPASWAMALLQSGNLTLDILGLAVALYTAYGIVGRPGLLPAFAGGLTAVTMDTGYLGGLAAGLLTGASITVLRKITVPARWRALMANVVVPLLATVITAVVFFSAVAAPLLAHLGSWLSDKLVVLELTDHHLWLGVLLGLLVCCDFGGALYKIAYAYALAGVNAYSPTPDHMAFMAATVAAGMVPSLGLSLATLVRRTAFTEAERNYGKVAWLLGVTGIPQGAFPFALRDPLRVIPATLAGGAVTGVLTMTFGPTMAVPHGGFFAIDQIGKPLLMVAAIAAGTLVTAGLTIALKCLRKAQATAAAHITTRTRVRTRQPMSG